MIHTITDLWQVLYFRQ